MKHLIYFLIALLSYSTDSQAQPYFNRLYTNNAFGSIYVAASPQGNNGGFMTVAYANDSTKAIAGVRITRFDKEGKILNSNYMEQTEYPLCTMYPRQAAIAKINDNRFAVVGDFDFPDGRGNYSFLILVDSACNLIKFKAYRNPFPLPKDSLMVTKDVAFDGRNLTMYSLFYDSEFSTKQLLTKFDTSLNFVWEKAYNEGTYSRRPIYKLIADDSGYVMTGVSDRYQYESKGFKSSTFVFRTDTAGVVQWRWNSPTMMSAATHIVRTADGGYVFPTMGNVYDRDSAHPTWNAYWYAQELLVKLRSDGTLEWQKLYDTFYFPNLGQTPIRLLATAESGFKTLRGYAKMPYVFGDSAFAKIRTYTKDGISTKDHKFPIPTDTPMKGTTALNDFMFTSDKSIVVAGYYDNWLSTAIAPAQRGWLLKVDSNGCMGDMDPQCDPLNIPKLPPLVEEGFKVYPNPAHHSIHLSIAANELKVFNTLGQIVLQTNNISVQQPIPVSQLSNGLYFIAVFDQEKNKIGVAKFYKE